MEQIFHILKSLLNKYVCFIYVFVRAKEQGKCMRKLFSFNQRKCKDREVQHCRVNRFWSLFFEIPGGGLNYFMQMKIFNKESGYLYHKIHQN